MRGLADKAWRRGWNAVLLNQRNCGGTEQLTPGLYHSGLTADPRAVIRALADDDGSATFGVVGYSLGGNLTMKLAGELADASRSAGPGGGRGQPDDRSRALRPRDRAARQHRVPVELRAQPEGAHAPQGRSSGPGAFDLTPLDGIWTIRAFDEIYTAPHHGFAGATDYYHRASAMRVVDRIRIPALILTAEDDPFVPAAQFDDPAVAGNPRIARAGRARTAATAASSARRQRRRRLLGGGDGGGVSRRRYATLRPRAASRSHERARELRPLPFLFVLEVDEHVVPGRAAARRRRPPSARDRPACSLRRAGGSSRAAPSRASGVVLSPKSAMHSAALCAASSANTSSVSHESWRNSNAQRMSAGSERQERLEPRQVALEGRRQLKQQRRRGAARARARRRRRTFSVSAASLAGADRA